MKIIEGGVCAAKGFKAGAMRCGIRKSHTKKDLAMILSDCVCNASAVYTTNRVKASPILLTKEHLADGKAQAVIVNSGNANACAPFGMENARRQAKAPPQASMEDGGLAQLGERLPCKQEVSGSIPLISTN